MDVNGSSKEVDHERLDNLRRGRGPIQEHIIDEFVAGRLSRRDFLRKGTAFGLSLPLLGGILEAKGLPGVRTAPATRAATGKAGAPIRAGILVPTGAINPITIADEGSLELLGNVGEFLVEADQSLGYLPWLATSWTPNATADVWTFTIRQGVKFNDGTPMTVDDVVYSFQSQCNPKTGGSALSVFSGLLSPDGVVKVSDTQVAFHLETPDGAFLDAVSCDNYNMIIVPNRYDYANYQKDWVGTGHFKMSSYSPNVGATFVPNPYYWGTPAIPSEIQWTFYASETPMTAALEANEIDCLDQFFVSTSPQLLNGSYNIIKLKGSGHRELSMRCDLAPFTNKYVRQAMGLLLDRPALVHSLFKGYADIGNDSPFAPVFPATVGPPAVPQRTQNLKMAKELLAKGGVPRGFTTPLLTEQRQEMPQLAQYIKQWASQIGVTIRPHDRDSEQVLRLWRLRHLGLAGRRDEHGRLRRPVDAEPVPQRTVGDAQHQDRDGRLERRPLQQRGLRQARFRVRLSDRPLQPAESRQADRDPAPRRDADHLPLLLQLPERYSEERDRRLPDGAQPVLPLERIEVLSTGLA